jgi:hypothetical protein
LHPGPTPGVTARRDELRIGEDAVLQLTWLIWPVALATLVVAVWLVRHPFVLLMVNVAVAAWITYGTAAAMAVAVAPGMAWWLRSLRWP